jgi:membrane protein DedA with SNARE-associated domain
MFNFIDLSDPQILQYIKTFGYPSLFLIMIIEGPIITIIGAFLASLGFFNVGIIFLLSVLGDMVGDMILYALGYWGGSKILSRAERWLKINFVTMEKLRRLFTLHGQKTIFYVKSTTGLCWITFILAGTLKMDFQKFLRASFLGGIVWSGFLVLSGFFFGYAFEKINAYLKSAGLIIFLLAASFIFFMTLYKKRQSRKILENGPQKI